MLAITKVDGSRLDALDQWCLRRLLDIKFVSNAKAQETSPSLIIQARHLSLFGHIVQLDDNANAKIVIALPPEDWKRPPGRAWITWMKKVLNDLESHNLTSN